MSFLTILILSSVQALAAPSPFDQILTKFSSAQTLTFADIDGWYSGRCFERTGKETALPGLLTITESALGPQFPGESQTYVLKFVGMDSRNNAAFFDHLNSAEEKEKLARLVHSQTPTDAKPSRVTPKQIETDIFFSDSRDIGTTLELRRDGAMFYMVERAKAPIRYSWRRTSNEGVEYKRGDVVEVCYYFLRIMSRQEADSLR